jgi:hypothetical protein
VFGIVDLEQSGSDVVIDAGVQGGNVFVAPTAAQYTFVFNLPATGRILQFVTTNFSQVSGTSFQDELFGNFNYAIVCISDCGTVLLFKVLNVTVADFLKSTDGTPSVFFAEDIQLAENGNSGSVGALGIREVPIPPAIALFGGGLALLNWASRRKR